MNTTITMRFLLITICLLLLGASFRQGSSIPVNCRQVIDSAEFFLQHSDFPSTREIRRSENEERVLTTSRWLERRSYAEFKCLLDHAQFDYRLIGYIYAGQQYMDSLEAHYAWMLKDTTTIRFYAPDGSEDRSIPAGTVFSMFHQGLADSDKRKKQRSEAEVSVASFIRSYARYPESYVPLEFPRFSMGNVTGEPITTLELHHAYRLKSGKGEVRTVRHSFVLDTTLRIRIIQDTGEHLFASYPPHLEPWLLRFGRPLTSKDSLDLHLK